MTAPPNRDVLPRLPNRTAPIEAIEVGLIDTAATPAPCVIPIAEIEGLSAYLRLEP